MGGFVVPPPRDAGCVTVGELWDFEATNRSLTEHACDYRGRRDLTVWLTDAQTTRLMSEAEAGPSDADADDGAVCGPRDPRRESDGGNTSD